MSTETRVAEPAVSFDVPPDVVALRDRIAEFIKDRVYPREHLLRRPDGMTWEVVQELRAEARGVGIYGPHLPVRLGGLGLDWRGVAVAFEEAGTSLLGPLAINGAAPDEGNMRLLEVVATPEQQERYLAPLAAGTVRSCFAMTEPAPGAGSDPTMLRTRARRDGRDWVIDGQKWYITGVDGAAFAIVMARTSDDPDPRRGATMFLVEAGTPGFVVERHIDSLDQTFLGGHCEVRFSRCRVGPEAVLGAVDEGFGYAQVRLAPARLTHCMRWLGIARRANEIAARRACERHGEGKPLGEHQMVQQMLADSAIDLHAARLMIWHAAWVLDSGGPAREETSMTKVFVAEAVQRVVDRAIQICGSLGVSEDLPLGLFYREVRPFRIYDGPSEVHRAAIARRLLRRARRSHA
ncbi:MAG: acyl-CoA dehydrogenase family protein [Chloroflexota bacterium]|nr:acyl-CoA dehydrogenase family protein [Chloroflexota bacterium]